ncbi:hypothetical protein QBC37DRAFT_170889 [Rhypophila decipiens]|uniref:C2H2-type domain-containing protein n=1 Tax=Rhypophila decipiens TaxID=261697 RepID=A0AAN6Y937_9PEZI|nr:hypothetical protein QBC37DRAFT_170889 [Rhypophila decipiens]
MAHGGASGKVSTSTTSTSKPEESSALRRKREEILQRSMEVFGRELDKWLDTTLAEPMQRVRKRARAADDHDSGVEEEGGSTSSSAAAKTKSQPAAVVVRNTKKRAKREPLEAANTTALAPVPVPTRSTPASPTGGDGPAPLFACPFYAHDPAKYKSVKTCCGPGWNNTHRVKEHIYRRHCNKHTCPRCCEQFKTDDELKHHQRLDEPCKKRERGVDHGNNNVITNEQEKQIRARAKTNQAEDEKWRELYRILFSASQKIPSPYYEQTPPATSVKAEDEPRPVATVPLAPSSSRTGTPSSSQGGPVRQPTRGLESIHFRDEAELVECRQHIHQGLRRRVRPLLEQEVDKMLRSVQHAMAQKVTELCKEAVTKLFRTWQFGNDQTQSQSQTSTPASTHRAGSQTQTSTGYAETLYGAGYDAVNYHHKVADTTEAGPIEVNYEQFVTETPAIMIENMLDNGEFDLEGWLNEYDSNGGLDFSSALGDTVAGASDSAYFSTLESGSVDGTGSSASFVGGRYGGIY